MNDKPFQMRLSSADRKRYEAGAKSEGMKLAAWFRASADDRLGLQEVWEKRDIPQKPPVIKRPKTRPPEPKAEKAAPEKPLAAKQAVMRPKEKWKL